VILHDPKDNPITRIVLDSVSTAHSYDNIENTIEARKLVRERKLFEEKKREFENLRLAKKNSQLFEI